MKKLIFLAAFLNLFLTGYNQIIHGTILDKETKSPITYATIYFEGTSIAAFSDGQGNFALDIKNNTSMPLTISALGYYSMSLNDFSAQKAILVYLTPKIFELHEISITAKGHPKIRKRNLEIFRREFLGRTKNAKKCEIVNEDDITFINSQNNDTLRAYSIKPLIINNKSLGYKITYFMDKFEYVKSQSINQLIGDFLFNDDTTSTFDDQMVELRRNYAYFGSKMHLIRSLWQKDLKSVGFIIKNGDREVTEQELIRYQIDQDPNKTIKYLYYSNRLPVFLTITYEPSQTESIMQILHNNIYFTREGYYKGHNIIWQGEMALHGVADLLPYDFKPTCDVGKLYIRKKNVPLYQGSKM
jgi:hypothetical protein